MDSALIDLNRRFDHAALKPETTEADIVRLCQEAVEYELFAVCVNPVWVARCREELAGTEEGRQSTPLRVSSVRIASVAGFPLGANRTEVKVDEAVRAVVDGAHEIDMVANIGWILDGRMAEVAREIRAVRDALPHIVALPYNVDPPHNDAIKNDAGLADKAAIEYGVVLKVIIEAGLLSPAQMAAATRAVIEGGAQFVKTSTGFFGGATAEQVRTLFAAVEGRVEVKASGGIRTAEDCVRMIEAGATRLGSSASAEILSLPLT